jgi:membrane protein DedA with SNARE-associated domain
VDFVTQNLIPYILLYKYITLFVVAFLAAFIVPIPSGNLLMIASGFASVGYLNIFWIIIISVIGNILGDNLSYFIARRYGIKVLNKIGFRRILNSKTFKKLEDKFNEHPGSIILASRFEVLSTLSINLLSGISKTNYKKFLIHEVVGSIAQVTFYSVIGYLFVTSINSFGSKLSGIIFVVFIVMILIVFLGKKYINRILN